MNSPQPLAFGRFRAAAGQRRDIVGVGIVGMARQMGLEQKKSARGVAGFKKTESPRDQRRRDLRRAGHRTGRFTAGRLIAGRSIFVATQSPQALLHPSYTVI